MSVFVTGDKHGEQEMFQLTKRRRPKPLTEGDILIIAGDFGLLWKDPPSIQEAHWRRWLEQSAWETLFVDGNHENFEIINKLPDTYR